MDAAGVDKDRTAKHVRYPSSIGKMSPFAIARGRSFEAEVKFDRTAILSLLRPMLELSREEAGLVDLNALDGESVSRRFKRSQSAIVDSAGSGPDAGTLFDHPILRLEISGLQVFLEPDMLAFRLRHQFHVLEIKSFAIIDGVAPKAKVTAAATQSAVYVLALRKLLADNGHDPALVSDKVILVCPKDFTNQATADFVDVRKPLTVLKRQLARMDNIDQILEAIPDGVTFDLAINAEGQPTRSPEDLAQAIRSVQARYAPECLSSCELGPFCRDETRAQGSAAALGRTVREDLGGVENLQRAMDYATGRFQPTPDLEQAARLLRMTYQVRQECLGGAA